MSNNSNAAFVAIAAGVVILVAVVVAATTDRTARWISLAIVALMAVVAGFALQAAKRVSR